MYKILWFICIGLSVYITQAQSLDIESIAKSKPFHVSGQLSANGVYYHTNQEQQAREPFTYFLQGGLTFNIYSFSIPLYYSFSNQGEDLGYQLPFDFNQLSLHPKYKWVTAHIGTVAMTFSPYTLNEHQFTGGGVDLSPAGAVKVSAMAGRLLKATEDTEDIRTVPAFNRMGYGLKTSIEKEKFSIGVIGFYAKDDLNSLDSVPEAKNVVPQENLVISVSGKVNLGNYVTVEAEYANSAITKDIRAEKAATDEFSIARLLFNNRSSTSYFNAIKTRLGFASGTTNIGLGYERIDPGYETLGAYFFNNDFENITLDASNTFFKDKLTLAFNIGYQRDDLNNEKANNTNRTVGSVNATWIVNDKLNLSGLYSNFSTFTNIKPNQFDEINDSNLLDEQIEALDYKQLSQTATLTLNYLFKNDKKMRKSITSTYSLNDVVNEQGGNVRIGDASTFHNATLGYTLQFIPIQLNCAISLNGTYNTIGADESNTWGPTFSIGKRFFDKTLSTRLSTGYNQSNSSSTSSNVTNIRANASYVLKEQHNFNLNATQVFRNRSNGEGQQDFTATLGYTYAFGLKKPKIRLPKRDKKPKKERKKKTKVVNDTITIKYKKYYFEDIPVNITPQLIAIPENGGFTFLSSTKKKELQELETQLYDSEAKDKRIYKSVAMAYLKSLTDYIDFEQLYNNLVYQSYIKLIAEARGIDRHFDEEYIKVNAKVNSAEIPNPSDLRRMKVINERHEAHRKMLGSLIRWDLTLEDIDTATGDFKNFRDEYLKKAFEMHDSGATDDKIIDFLELHLADYFHRKIEE